MNEQTITKQDYLYCITCDTIFDYWKYDGLEDTGHAEHDLRELTDEEFKEAVQECIEDGCFDDS